VIKPRSTDRLPVYAARQASALLANLVKQIGRVRAAGDPDSIHDLRVAVRRLAQCLDVFESLFPPGAARRVRKRVTRLRRAAGLPRDCDIALEYLALNPLPDQEAFAAELKQTRKRAQAALRKLLDRVDQKRAWEKWRRRLGLAETAP
jgi:CHAD domain-containing protein